MKHPILIATSSPDAITYNPVREILERNGYPVVAYHGDEAAEGKQNLRLEIDEEGELSVNCQDRDISPQHIGSAWYRKVGSLSLLDAGADEAKSMHINNELRYTNTAIWSLYSEKKWLNSPNRIIQSQAKLGQLVLAKNVGFSIPHTTMGNNWEDIERAMLPEGDESMIVKMMHGVISENNVFKALYTTPIDVAKLDEIRDHTIPFPGIYQPFIDKAREWRVTAVGDEVFPAAIYTGKTAKDDWRKHQATEAVEFKEEQLPEGFDEKCSQYLKEMGLKFGAFDFIEKPDGEMVFLECNPNGQYGWLEEKLDFPISEAIASELMKIAKE